MEYVYECFAGPNLPFTIMLILVSSYWLMVIFGFLGAEAFDLDLDLDVDAGVDIDAGVDVDGDFDVGGASGGGFGTSALTFFHFHEAPLMLIVSIFTFNMWAVSLLSNHYLNAEYSWVISLLWFGPNLILCLLLTKLILLPFVPLFRYISSGEAAKLKIVGQTCLITTSEVTAKFGMAEIPQEGPPVQINVRAEKGEEFRKGDIAEVTAYDRESNTYSVRRQIRES